MVDRLAEPARLPLYPGFARARAAATAAGAFGVAVSGAGPTALAVVPAGAEGAVGEALVAGYGEEGVAARVHVAAVDARGARLE
jgi:homoserine kinase